MKEPTNIVRLEMKDCRADRICLCDRACEGAFTRIQVFESLKVFLEVTGREASRMGVTPAMEAAWSHSTINEFPDGRPDQPLTARTTFFANRPPYVFGCELVYDSPMFWLEAGPTRGSQ